MAKLTTKARNKLPAAKFAEPGARKFPINNPSHAANAKSRASEMENKGKISASTKSKIDAKADRVLGEKPEKTKAPKGHEYLGASKHFGG